MEKNDIHTKPPELSPTLRVIPMPSDTNAYGDIFGGWLLSQMDLAGASEATDYAGQRVVTVGVEGMNFHKPVFVGDEVSFYTTMQRVGRTSMNIHVEAWARARTNNDYRRVTEGVFTFVAIDKNRNPTEIKK